MMELDRKLQLDILRALRDVYPADAGKLPFAEDPNLLGNLWYLHEHGLIEGTAVRSRDPVFAPRTITALGLDFLEDDGGLSAILGTVTIKFDPDDLRSLMAERVESSDLPAEERNRLAHVMRSLPEQALRDLITRLVNESVTRWPEALQLFQTCVAQ